MADFDPSADLTGAANYGNFLSKQDLEVRKTNAYAARQSVYGNMLAQDPEAVSAAASAEVDQANAPNVIAANAAKAKALAASTDTSGPFGAGAVFNGNPAAQTENLANQETSETNSRQAQVRGIKMLQASVPAGSDSVDPGAFDRIVGQNAKTLGLTDPDQLASFKAAVTAPGGAQHLDGIASALMAPQTVVGAKPIVYGGPDGKTAFQVQTTKDGQTSLVPLGGVTQASVFNNNNNLPIKQENADTNRMAVPIKQQNANTAAASANTRTNNSNFGNPGGFVPQGGALPGDNRPSADFNNMNKPLAQPSVDLIHAGNPGQNTHVGNADGTATTPVFDRLAPVGSKARSNAIAGATSIVNADTQLQNTNNVIGQLTKQISPYSVGTGSLIKNLPGTVQANVKANLQSISASGLMSFIQSVKAGGPGGTGGLRLASEANAAMALYGNMEQDQTAQQLGLHLKLFQQTVNQLHDTAQNAFKAQWRQDPYALVGAVPGKGGAGGPASPAAGGWGNFKVTP